MEKKNILGLGILLMVLVVLGAILFNIYINRETIIEDLEEPVIVDIKYDDFDFVYNYKGEGTWEYTITGTLPNPCYQIKTEAIVAESFPEQVTVKSVIVPPDPELVCAQVIQDVLERGEFEASESATVTFKIE